MEKEILAVDVGTTAMKVGVFSHDFVKRKELRREYHATIVDEYADIEPEIWWETFVDICRSLGKDLKNIDTISFSVTSPGLTPMDRFGTPLAPAVLFLDTRSYQEAKSIRQKVGEDYFLQHTMNLPVPGGSSLATILWFRNKRPDIYEKTHKFGHTNSFFIKRLTGNWVVDPSSISITGLYNSVANDLTYNSRVLDIAGISEDKLPQLYHSYEVVGNILPEPARELGLSQECKVLCGGNDAVLAAYSAGITRSGQVLDICGTCEILSVCLESPISSSEFNVRCHVIPGKWMTLFVLNAGGISYDWFHQSFCREMEKEYFYSTYIKKTISEFLCSESRDDCLPGYMPYLQGSRYSLEKCGARFDGLTSNTSREDLFLSLLKGNFQYLKGNLNALEKLLPVSNRVITSGGGAKIPGIELARRRWLGDYEYRYRDQSSLLGAAMLAQLA